MMRQYAESGQCRGRTLLAYFGEQADGRCGHCDNCAAAPAVAEAVAVPAQRSGKAVQAEAVAASASTVDADAEPRPFPVNSGVVHTEWGQGTVMAYERDRMVVLFEAVGYRTLSVPVVQQRKLLVPA